MKIYIKISLFLLNYKTDYNTIKDNLLQNGVYWFDENYCFETISVVL